MSNEFHMFSPGYWDISQAGISDLIFKRATSEAVATWFETAHRTVARKTLNICRLPRLVTYWKKKRFFYQNMFWCSAEKKINKNYAFFFSSKREIVPIEISSQSSEQKVIEETPSPKSHASCFHIKIILNVQWHPIHKVYPMKVNKQKTSFSNTDVHYPM